MVNEQNENTVCVTVRKVLKTGSVKAEISNGRVTSIHLFDKALREAISIEPDWLDDLIDQLREMRSAIMAELPK